MNRLHPLDSDVVLQSRIRKLHREKEELIEIINYLNPARGRISYTLLDSDDDDDDNESDQQ